MQRPRVLVVALGGTIAMTVDQTGRVTPSLTAQQLVDAVPGLADAGLDIDVLSFRSQPGASLTIADIIELYGEITRRLGGGLTGVVITQGTDTIEETAYLLDLLHPGPQPIVVTGAMRNPTQAGADGPANLLAAIRVAASPAARDLGCLVVLADDIHAARRVRKSHSTSVATFVSPNGGPLGHLVEGSAIIVNRLPGRHTLPAPRDRLPRIGLYTATLGDDGSMMEGVARAVDGLVVAGFGVGHVPEPWLPALTTVGARIPVVLTSRTGSGPVLAGTYGFPGSESDLLGRGMIPAGLLDPYKARILLMLALAAGRDHEQISAAFAAAGGLGPVTDWP
ncbi:L-asparaginase [Mangrovihabitans endophyticus]|uniref:L-asparaginase n=1 Tax=Mangrovihabitans endophyticus TaxID=1751298 RepID=A0A8J3BSP3_9ACTN|nr:L-asparaginase [Mangrovihabitans endophyticus]